MLNFKALTTTAAIVSGIMLGGIFDAGSVKAAVLFEDNFDSEPVGLGKTTLTKWNVTAGNVDVIGNSFFDLYPGNGRYLDMDGTPAANATIRSKALLNLNPGTYQLSFKLGRNGSGNSLLVQLGSVFAETFAATPTLTSIVRSFTVTSASSAVLSFAEQGTPNLGGSILDAVRLEQTQATAIPTPALLPGLIALGVTTIRKRKAEQKEAVEV